jgi:hypothetical protein
MSPPKQSLSQLFNSFGPGAMMDLPTRSVVIAGLDHWDGNKAAFKSISEPRLTALLQTVLSQTGRWEPGKPVQLRTPPIARENRNEPDPAGIAVRVFPTWFTCEGIVESGATNPRRRRLVRWTELDAAGNRKKFQRDDGKKIDVTPIRFVGACKDGHLQDIDWKWSSTVGQSATRQCGLKNRGQVQIRRTYESGASASDPAYRLPTRSNRAFSEPVRGIGLGWIRQKPAALNSFIFFRARQQIPISPKP